MQKLGQVGAWPRSHYLHLNFGIAHVSLVKSETSNLVCRLNVTCTNQKMQRKIRISVAQVMWPTFIIFVTLFWFMGPLLYLWKW